MSADRQSKFFAEKVQQQTLGLLLWRVERSRSTHFRKFGLCRSLGIFCQNPALRQSADR
jgi:hypothetical protein